MNTKILIISFLILTGLLANTKLYSQASPQQISTLQNGDKILFVGNSFTEWSGPLPSALQSIITASGSNLNITCGSKIKGMGILKEYATWNSLGVINEIKTGNYKYVVIQGWADAINRKNSQTNEDGSTNLDYIGYPACQDTMLKYFKILDAEVKKVGATTILYEPHVGSIGWATDKATSAGTYSILKNEVSCFHAPVINAWDAAIALHPTNYASLFFAPDGGHQGPTGMVLDAMTFYTFLTGRSAATLKPNFPIVITDPALYEELANIAYTTGKAIRALNNSTLNDTQNPTQPTNITVTNKLSDSFTLNWTSSTDDIGVLGYKVYQNNVLLGTTATPKYNVSGLQASTSYTMKIVAFDSEGKESTSNAIDVTTSAFVSVDFTGVLYDWNFTGTNGASTSVTTNIAQGMSGSAPSAVLSFHLPLQTRTGFNNNALVGSRSTALTLADAIAGNQYMTFSVAPQAGNNFSISQIVLKTISEGVHNFTLMSEVNGFTAGNEIGTYPETSPNNTVAITGHDNLNSVKEFRIYIWGSSNQWTAYGISDLIVSGTVKSTALPLFPTNLSTSNLTETGFTLNWKASQDAVSYEVFKNGISIGTTTSININVTGVTIGSTYSMTVKATNSLSVVSEASSPLSVTIPDLTKPSVPQNLSVSGLGEESFVLNWTASTDNIAVTKYEVLMNGIDAGNTAAIFMPEPFLTPNTKYTMKVRALDAAGNASDWSAPFDITTLVSSDVTPPTAPTNVSSSVITTNSFTVSWTASTDNKAVTSYEIFKDGNSAGTTTTTTYNLSGLTPSTTYIITVKAKDLAGNISAASSDCSVKTSGTPPASGTLATWNFNGINGAVSATAGTVEAGISTVAPSTEITRGAGFEKDSYGGNCFGGYGNDKTTLADAITANDYLSFFITPSAGKSITINAIKLRPNTQAEPRSFALFSNVGGFTADKVIGTVNTAGEWITTEQTIAISGLSNITVAVEFRIYIYGSSNYWTNASLGQYPGHPTTNDLVIEGSVADAAADTEAPSVPANLESSLITSNSFTLSWAASSDNTVVGYYEVFKEGISVGTTTSTTINVTGLNFSTTYAMTVKAYDLVPNVSAASVALNVTTDVYSDPKLTGTYFSTPPYGPTYAKEYAFDGNTTTFFAAQSPDPSYIGIDLGANFQITKIKYFPRAGYENRMGTGKFQGSNTLDFSTGVVDLNTLPTYPTAGWNTVTISNTDGFRYIRYIASVGNGADVAELEFYGHSFVLDTEPPSVPSGLAESNKSQNTFTLSWNASTDNIAVTSYEVFKDEASYGTTTSNTLNITGLLPSTTYSMTVKAKDAAGNISAASSVLNVTTSIAIVDNEAPSVPTNLASADITSNSFTLSWTASTDNVAVTSYEVLKDGVSIGTTTSTTISVTGLSAFTLYSMTVKAKDAAGNVSVGASVNVKTLIFTPVSVALVSWNYTGSNSTATKVAGTVASGISTTAPSTVSEIASGINPDVYVGNCFGGSGLTQMTLVTAMGANDYIKFTVTPENGKQITITEIKICATSQSSVRNFALLSSINGFSADKAIYTFSSTTAPAIIPITGHVKIKESVEFRLYIYGATGSYDNASLGQWGSHPTNDDLTIKGYVSDIVIDVTAPTVPENLSTSDVIANMITLAWNASTDEEGVTAYEVFKDGISVGTTASTSYTFYNLSCNTSYSITVKAKDLAGNISAASTALVQATNACSSDNEAPTAPTNVSASNISVNSFKLIWTAATDNIGVTSYEVFKEDVSIGNTTTTEFVVTGLNCETTYAMTVKASDNNGNTSQASIAQEISTKYCPENMNIYFIGNSVTDGINYTGFQEMALTEGNFHTYGRQMIPGAPLVFLWQNPTAGFTAAPYGVPTNAFPNYKWTALSLQPFTRFIGGGDDGELKNAGNFINLAISNSPDVQVYIYQRWPATVNDSLGKPSTTAELWNTKWLSTYVEGNWSTEFGGQDYSQQIVYAIRAQNNFGAKKVLMSPVGQVMYELNKKMAAGQVNGYNKIWDVYGDGIHLNGVGEYIIACTYYATVYKADPRGTAVPSVYGIIPSDVVSVIQQTVWDVVTTYRDNEGNTWSGVNVAANVPVTSINLDNSILNIKNGNNAQLFANVLPSNATNKNVLWSSSNELIATVSNSGEVTAQGVGNATITAKTVDVGLIATCSVVVTTDVTIDDSAPSIPTNLATSSISDTQIALSWTGSTDNVGVIGYNVYAGTTKLNTNIIQSTSYTITGLTECTNYSLIVEAKDAAGNLSTSSPLQKKTNCSPTAVLNASVLSGTAPVTVNFNSDGSTDPDEDDFILGFEWDFGDGSAFENGNTPSHTYNSAGEYTVSLRVMDNRGMYSPPVTKKIEVTSVIVDNQPPTEPTGLNENLVTQNSFTLSWQASTDNVNVVSYEVFKDGVSIGTTTSASFNVTGLSANTYYTITIKAKDAAGNVSEYSVSLVVKTDFPVGVISLEKNNLTVFPNPATDFITIKIDNCTDFVNLIFMDIQGHTISVMKKMNPNTPISISEFNSGFYLLRVERNDCSEIKSLIIQK